MDYEDSISRDVVREVVLLGAYLPSHTIPYTKVLVV